MKDDQLTRQKRFSRTSVVRTPTVANQTNQPAITTTVKRLTWEEMQQKRAQGLCFDCNVKFTLGHKCQVSQLLLLEGSSQTEINEGIESATAGNELELLVEEKKPDITLHALMGWNAPKTMRIKATIGTHEVVALTDNGSTHDFISNQLASKLRLLMKPTMPFQVRVASGEHLNCTGKYEELPVNLQATEFQLDLLDMVLGVQWLETLGLVM